MKLGRKRLGQVILQGQDRSAATIGAQERNRKGRRYRNLETAIEFLTASPSMGPTTSKPAEPLLFCTSTNADGCAVAERDCGRAGQRRHHSLKIGGGEIAKDQVWLQAEQVKQL